MTRIGCQGNTLEEVPVLTTTNRVKGPSDDQVAPECNRGFLSNLLFLGLTKEPDTGPLTPSPERVLDPETGTPSFNTTSDNLERVFDIVVSQDSYTYYRFLVMSNACVEPTFFLGSKTYSNPLTSGFVIPSVWDR